MKSFDVFLEEEYLEESLNTPIEFYMTDDTEMPREIYAAFSIDGTDYGMSLVLTKYAKVYALDFYRIVNVKKRFWSFLKPAHIRKSLSTIIKFMESAYPFLQSKMDGVIISVPGKSGSEKYINFLGRMLKRSYIKKYREVPIYKKTKDARNYLFMVKQGVQPTNLFKTAAFHKHFKFDTTKGEEQIDSVVMDIASEPYKKLSPSVSTNPSTKYAFGAFKIDYVGGEDLQNMLNSASEMHQAQPVEPETPSDTEPSGGGDDESYKPALVIDPNLQSAWELGPLHVNHTDKKLSINLPHLVALLLPSVYEKHKNSSSTLNPEFSISEIHANFSKLPESVQKTLIDAGIMHDNGSLVLSTSNIQTIRTCVSSFKNIHPAGVKGLELNLKLTDKSTPKEDLKKKYLVIIGNTPKGNVVSDSFVGDPSFEEFKNMVGETVITINYAHLMPLLLPKAYENIQAKGFDESKVDMNNLSYAFKQSFSSMPEVVKSAMVNDIDFIKDTSGDFKPSDNFINVKTVLTETLRLFEVLTNKEKINELKTKIEEIAKNTDDSSKSPKTTSEKVLSDKMTLKYAPSSTLAGFDTANESVYNSGVMGFEEKGEDAEQKMQSVLSMPGFGEWYNSFDGFGDDLNMKTLHRYTGSMANDMNTGIRDMVKSGKEFKIGNIAPGSVKNKVLRLLKYFKKAPKLEKGIWVYRNALKISGEEYKVGDDYIDPGFMSTSVRSSMSLGAGGKLRLKIYLPAGTPCFPVFKKSTHPSEDEIVLPACSAMKIVERYEDTETDRIMLVCVYMGHGFEDLLEKGETGVMIEQKNNTTKNSKDLKFTSNKKLDYDPESKWLSAPTKAQLDAMRKTIKTGKFKLKF